MKKSELQQIIKEEILKELDIKKKTPLGQGYQQTAYPYLKDPNYVIKRFDSKSDQHILDRWEIQHYLKMQKLYPKYIAKIIIPNKNVGYYFQEKVDVKKAAYDIWEVVVEVIKKAALDLEKKYETPSEAAEDLDLPNIFHYAGDWEDIKNINHIKDVFNIIDEDIPMGYLFNKYIYSNYSKNIPLVQKLKPVYNAGDDATEFGEFHESNLGYDKDGNFKIIDI
jgi:hypothetical protein